MGKTIFITGSTGNIGGEITCQILKSDLDSHVILLIRAHSAAEAMDRVANTFNILSPELDFSLVRDRISVCCGDITEDRLGLDGPTITDLSEDLTHIIHCAAGTRHDVDLEEAREINLRGTLNVMELARMAKKKGRLQCVAHVSTAYVCGNRDGTILENELISDPGFSNTYQQTKWETELAIRDMCEELPIIIFRPSIVTGSSSTGRIIEFNVLYTPLRWLYQGLVSFLPGSADIPLDVVPLDFVAQVIRYILFMPENNSGTTFHVAAGRKRSTTVGEILDSGIHYFRRKSPSQSLKKVRFVSPQLVETVFRLLPVKHRRSLDKLKVFKPYICVEREFDTTNTEKALAESGISPPAFSSYFENIMDFCFATQWGKKLQRSA